MEKSIFIIILFWNRLEETIECLESVFNSDYPNYHVIVLDNASDADKSKLLLQKFPNVKYVRSDKNLGFTGGNNLGCELAISEGTDYLFLFNNDATLQPDTISKLVNFAESHERVGLISPAVKSGNDSDENTYLGTYLDLAAAC